MKKKQAVLISKLLLGFVRPPVLLHHSKRQQWQCRAISKRILDIAQTTSLQQDEYFRDDIIDLEHNNNDTMMLSRS